ncbi:hypothetical protein BVX95_02425 [archaeon D22]|nr:hypothetical protein BVX95_02425 [archaeon D22]
MKHSFKGFVYVLVFSLTWSFMALTEKYAMLKGNDPIKFAFQHFVVAAILMFFYVMYEKRSITKIDKNSFYKIILIGVLGSGIAYTLNFIGLKYTTSMNFGFIIKSTVIFSVLLAHFFLKEKMSLQKGMYVIVLLFGVYLISTKGETFIPRSGDLLILSSAFLISSANVISKPVLKNHSPEIVSFYRFLVAILFLLVIGLVFVPNFFEIQNPLLVLGSGLFDFLTILFLYKTIKETNVSYMTMMSMMFSVFVAIFGYLILSETFVPIQLLGAALIIGSVVMIHKSKI